MSYPPPYGRPPQPPGHPPQQPEPQRVRRKLILLIVVPIVVFCCVVPGALGGYAMLETGPEVGDCLASAKTDLFGHLYYVDCDSAEAKYVVITRMESRTYSCAEGDGVVKISSAPPSNRTKRPTVNAGDGWSACLKPK